MNTQRFFIFVFFITYIFLSTKTFADAPVRGIYINQGTLENSRAINYLIRRSQEVGINTFVIDFNRMSKAYRRNIELVKNSGIRYVARVVVFPGGGLPYQVRSEAYWRKKYALAEQAISLGAQAIQLDYIRYTQSMPASRRNAEDVYRVIQYFKEKLASKNIPLQIDVFGISSFGHSYHIGQYLPLFAKSVDAICPMLYPSHFEPYRVHAKQPYETVLDSLESLRSQFSEARLPFKLYPYIELFNYRYPLSTAGRFAYIRAQLRAARDGDADGWFAWSASNVYDNLFLVLQEDERRYVANKKEGAIH